MSDTETQHPTASATDSAPPAPPRPEKKATLRLGQREMSRLTALVIVLIAIPLCFGLYNLFFSFRSHRDIVIGQSNLLALWKAMNGYAQDWDGQLPPAADWTDSVAGYLSASPSMPGGKLAALEGPGDKALVRYVYNDLAAGFNLEHQDPAKYIDPGRLVVLIERPGAGENAHVAIPPQGNLQGEEALFKQLQFPHYTDDPENATTLVLFADGHIERMQKIEFEKHHGPSQE